MTLEGGGNKMAIKLVTYDLNKQGQDYKDLYREIKSIGPCINPLDSVWLIKTELTCLEIKKKLRSVMDTNDHIIVVPYANDKNGERSSNLKKEFVNWIQANI